MRDMIFLKFDALFKKKYVKISSHKLYINMYIYVYLFRIRKEITTDCKFKIAHRHYIIKSRIIA